MTVQVLKVTWMLCCVDLSCSYRPSEGLLSLQKVDRALNLTTSQKHTNSREQIHSGDTKNQSVTQEITHPLRNTGVHHRAHNSPHKGKGKVHPRTGHEGPEVE
jgi:hypothetical protein